MIDFYYLVTLSSVFSASIVCVFSVLFMRTQFARTLNLVEERDNALLEIKQKELEINFAKEQIHGLRLVIENFQHTVDAQNATIIKLKDDILSKHSTGQESVN